MKSAFDLIVRNGIVADGTGGEPYVADVAIAGGRIARIEPKINATGAEEIRADDLLVTPGFVDVHTHYDAQVTWDTQLGPSSHHGVTTVVMSNCGVGFAPCKPEDRELLVELMEGIEDIPDVVMTEGLPWAWQSFPEYLDFLETRHADVDFATQVPHSPVRVFVMGQRAANLEPASGNDVRAMAQIVGEGIRAGALGFTTSRLNIHRTVAGRLVPTATASEDELRTIALAMRDAGGGVMELAEDFDRTEGVSTIAMWSRIVAESGRPLSFAVGETLPDPDRWRRVFRDLEAANAAGLPIKAQVPTRPIGVLLGLDLSSNPFITCPTYMKFATKPLAERVELMRRPEIREAILREEPAAYIRPIFRNTDEMFEFGDPPNYEPAPDARFGVRAKQLGISSRELAYDVMLKDEGRALLYLPVVNYCHYSLDTTLEMMRHPNTIAGLSDGGAHIAAMCDVAQGTHLLTHWTRDRAGERLGIAEAVRMLTRDTSEALGLYDRGVLAPGYRADLNVIDYHALKLHGPKITHDLPAGGARFMQRADGYRATVKGGTVTYRDGTPTGALPGRLIRGAQPAPA